MATTRDDEFGITALHTFRDSRMDEDHLANPFLSSSPAASVDVGYLTNDDQQGPLNIPRSAFPERMEGTRPQTVGDTEGFGSMFPARDAVSADLHSLSRSALEVGDENTPPLPPPPSGRKPVSQGESTPLDTMASRSEAQPIFTTPVATTISQEQIVRHIHEYQAIGDTAQTDRGPTAQPQPETTPTSAPSKPMVSAEMEAGDAAPLPPEAAPPPRAERPLPPEATAPATNVRSAIPAAPPPSMEETIVPDLGTMATAPPSANRAVAPPPGIPAETSMIETDDATPAPPSREMTTDRGVVSPMIPAAIAPTESDETVTETNTPRAETAKTTVPLTERPTITPPTASEMEATDIANPPPAPPPRVAGETITTSTPRANPPEAPFPNTTIEPLPLAPLPTAETVGTTTREIPRMGRPPTAPEATPEVEATDVTTTPGVPPLLPLPTSIRPETTPPTKTTPPAAPSPEVTPEVETTDVTARTTPPMMPSAGPAAAPPPMEIPEIQSTSPPEVTPEVETTDAIRETTDRPSASIPITRATTPPTVPSAPPITPTPPGAVTETRATTVTPKAAPTTPSVPTTLLTSGYRAPEIPREPTMEMGDVTSESGVLETVTERPVTAAMPTPLLGTGYQAPAVPTMPSTFSNIPATAPTLQARPSTIEQSTVRSDSSSIVSSDETTLGGAMRMPDGRRPGARDILTAVPTITPRAPETEDVEVEAPGTPGSSGTVIDEDTSEGRAIQTALRRTAPVGVDLDLQRSQREMIQKVWKQDIEPGVEQMISETAYDTTQDALGKFIGKG